MAKAQEPTTDTFDPNAPDANIDAMMANLNTGGAGGGDNEIDFLASLDMSKVKEGALDILTNGETYDFEVTSITSKISQGSGNKVYYIKLKVTEGYAEAGKEIMDNITMTEKSLWKFKSFCRAAGLLSNEGTFIGTGLDSFIGTIVSGKVKTEPWDGVDRSKIDGSYKIAENIAALDAEATTVVPNFG